MLYLNLQPYGVQANFIKMTQEEIEEACRIMREADAMIPKTKEASHKFLVDAGIIKEPKKAKKARRQTKK